MLRAGQMVFLCALALLMLGVIMVSSAMMSLGPVEVSPTSAGAIVQPDAQRHTLSAQVERLATSKSVIYMGMAIAAMALTSLFPLSRLLGPWITDSPRARAVGKTFLAVSVIVLIGVVLLVYVPGLGRIKNGAHRWIFLGGEKSELSIQPSEFAKWGLIIALSVYAATHASVMHRFFRGLVPGLVALGLVAGIVAHEDLGTGVLIAGVGTIVLLAGGARLGHFLMFVPPALAGVALLIITSPYRLQRIETFLNPYEDPKGTGFHMIQSMVAIANGEGWGRGLGDGLQKFGYLPEDTTDFLFSITAEELGIAGAALIIALYAALLWSGLVVVRKQREPVMKMIALGVIATVGLQALINLAVVTGLGPTKGIALPLMSRGGTGWILTAASLGLLVGMDRRASRRAPSDAGASPLISAAEGPSPGPSSPPQAAGAGDVAAILSPASADASGVTRGAGPTVNDPPIVEVAVRGRTLRPA